MKSIKSTG